MAHLDFSYFSWLFKRTLASHFRNVTWHPVGQCLCDIQRFLQKRAVVSCQCIFSRIRFGKRISQKGYPDSKGQPTQTKRVCVAGELFLTHGWGCIQWPDTEHSLSEPERPCGVLARASQRALARLGSPLIWWFGAQWFSSALGLASHFPKPPIQTTKIFKRLERVPGFETSPAFRKLQNCRRDLTPKHPKTRIGAQQRTSRKRSDRLWATQL